MAKESFYDEIKEQRLRAAYPHRRFGYINADVSLNEALAMFSIPEEPTCIKKCAKGVDIEIWDHIQGWKSTAR